MSENQNKPETQNPAPATEPSPRQADSENSENLEASLAAGSEDQNKPETQNPAPAAEPSPRQADSENSAKLEASLAAGSEDQNKPETQNPAPAAEPAEAGISSPIEKEAGRIREAAKQVFGRVVVILFNPLKLDYKKPFHWGTFVLIFLTFIALLVLASPFVVKPITEKFLSAGFRTNLFENKDWINSWIEYLSFFFEVLIAFAIGGMWFTDPIAEGLKEQLTKSQNAQDAAFAQTIPKRQRELTDLGNEIISLQAELILAQRNWPGLKNFVGKQYELFTKTRKLMASLYPGIPEMYLRFLVLKFVINFPKGIYGLLAFIMFLALSLLKVMEMYVNSPWLKVTIIGQ